MSSRVLRSHVPPLIGFSARLVTISVALVCMLWLSVLAHFQTSNPSWTPVRDDHNGGGETAWAGAGESGQFAVAFGGVKVNVEAYNKKREKDIANASRKLLSLAISLKSDLEHDSGLSSDAIKKAREIEKLAHNVKETMRINIIGPH